MLVSPRFFGLAFRKGGDEGGSKRTVFLEIEVLRGLPHDGDAHNAWGWAIVLSCHIVGRPLWCVRKLIVKAFSVSMQSGKEDVGDSPARADRMAAALLPLTTIMTGPRDP